MTLNNRMALSNIPSSVEGFSVVLPQTRCLGRAWSNLDFLSNFLASCFYRSLLYEFLSLFGCARSHAAQTRWVGGAWANFVFWSNFWRVVMIGVRCTSFFLFFLFCFVLFHILACTRLKLGGWEKLGPPTGFLKLFFGEFSWEVHCTRVFFLHFFPVV